jgi:hypothetical protein
MMRVFLSILSLSSTLSFTQTFGEVGTVWKNYMVYSRPAGSPGAGYTTDNYTSRYEYVSDSIIGNDTLQIISICGTVQKINSSQESYEYTDTLFVKQYSLEVYSGNSINNMSLCYDFNLTVGDSFPVSSPVPYPEDTIYSKVIDVDSIMINGSYRKTIQFDDLDAVHEPGMYWIEGVGDTTHGVFRHSINIYAWYSSNCFIENGMTYIGDCESDYPCPEYSDTTPSPIQAPDSIGLELINIYPNPFYDDLFITYAPTTSVYTIRLYDLKGEQVYYTQSSGTHAVMDLRHLADGVYFLEVYGRNKRYRKRLVKQ